MYADHLLAPWLERLREELPDLDIFDAHTHVGTNDPSGFSVTREQLLESVEIAGARAATFPLKEPEGFHDANTRAIELAEESDGRLVAFCRLDPADGPLEEARRCLERGAQGIKLHPA